MSAAPQPDRQLNVLSFGAGAIGTYIGGSLALQNHRLVFLERPGVVAELTQKGLHLELGEGKHHLPEPVVVSSLPAALEHGLFDVALFAFKAYDTESITEELIQYRRQLPPLLCLQNGVENEGLLSAALGADKVIAGTVTSAIGRRGPGDIVLERLRGMGIAAGHPFSAQLAQALSQAGLNARLFKHADDMKWSKMLTNLVGNATSAILGIPPAQVFVDPELYELEIKQLREAIAVMQALHIRVTDLPGTPVRMLAFAARRLPTWLSQPFIRKSVGGGRGNKMPSFYIDLHSGQKKSEVAYLNGAVVRYGQRLAIPTPANQFFTETLLDLVAGKLPLDKYRSQPALLVDEFRRSI